MQSFIFALLLASVTGVTAVAFRHPKGYARLFPYLLLAVSLIFIAVTIWQGAVELTWHRVEPFIADDSVDVAESSKPGLSVAYGWVVLWYVATSGFLWVNLKLPPFLQLTDNARPRPGGKEPN